MVRSRKTGPRSKAAVEPSKSQESTPEPSPDEFESTAGDNSHGVTEAATEADREDSAVSTSDVVAEAISENGLTDESRKLILILNGSGNADLPGNVTVGKLLRESGRVIRDFTKQVETLEAGPIPASEDVKESCCRFVANQLEMHQIGIILQTAAHNDSVAHARELADYFVRLNPSLQSFIEVIMMDKIEAEASLVSEGLMDLGQIA